VAGIKPGSGTGGPRDLVWPDECSLKTEEKTERQCGQ